MKYILILISALLITSCLGDCDTTAEMYQESECLIIVKKVPNPKSLHRFKIIGLDPGTLKEFTYAEENRWFCSFYSKIESGDTIIKRKGQLSFNIHKKDTTLIFNYECNGKTYK